MIINKKVINYLKNSCKVTGNCFYITSLDNVEFFLSTTSLRKINKPISKKLTNHLLNFINIKSFNEDLIILEKNKNEVTPIFENYNDINWNSQIIVPLFIDETLIGCLIMVSYYKNFTIKHYTLLKTIKTFVTKLLLESINKKYFREHFQKATTLKNMKKKKNK